LNNTTITKESTLEEIITKFQENGWIDCTENDAFDGDEFDVVMKYLKENKALNKKLERIKEHCKTDGRRSETVFSVWMRELQEFLG